MSRKSERKFQKIADQKVCDAVSLYIFQIYIYDLHELINTMLGKRSGLSYEMVRERYEHFRSRCATNSKTQKKRQTQKQKQKRKQKREDGCTEPIVGEKSKCVINIVPKTEKVDTFNMDKRCEKIRASNL